VKTIISCGLFAFGMGAGLIFQALRIYGHASAGLNNGAFPVGLLFCLIGVLMIALPGLCMIKLFRRWRNYVSAGTEFARVVLQEGAPLSAAPKRPCVVAGHLFDYTTAQPLTLDAMRVVLERDLIERIRGCLQSVGEKTTSLGVTTLRTYTANGRFGGTLNPTWVIDREWDDGRMTTEWFYAGPAGTRLRLVGGASAFGPISSTRKLVLTAATILGISFWAGQLGTPFIAGCIGFTLLMFPALWTLLWLLKSQADPVCERANPLTTLCDDPVAGEQSAAKQRIQLLLSDIEPLHAA